MKYNPTIYVNNDDNSCRFALGTEGVKPLIVIGINPSTADDKIADPTIRKVMGFTEGNGFDSFIMLNLYPQRTPYPDDLPASLDLEKHNQNLKTISEILEKHNNATLLAAWGDRVIIRAYLKECIKSIFETTKKFNLNWIYLGNLTTIGQPRHPLFTSFEVALTNFDIENYIHKLK
jgi:hypothetical protein